MSRRSIPKEFTEADLSAIESAAKIVASRYRGYVDFNDLTQEAYLWLVENYNKVLGWREEYSELHSHRMVLKSMRNACERYARKEKAQMDGYDRADEFFYSIPMVADLLRLYFDPQRLSVPAQASGPKVSGGSNAHEGGNLMAMSADVGRAYEALPEHDRALLWFVYGRGEPQDNIADLAEQWGIEPKPAGDRVRRVAGRLRERLGGASPYGGEK